MKIAALIACDIAALLLTVLIVWLFGGVPAGLWIVCYLWRRGKTRQVRTEGKMITVEPRLNGNAHRTPPQSGK